MAPCASGVDLLSRQVQQPRSRSRRLLWVTAKTIFSRISELESVEQDPEVSRSAIPALPSQKMASPRISSDSLSPRQRDGARPTIVDRARAATVRRLLSSAYHVAAREQIQSSIGMASSDRVLDSQVTASPRTSLFDVRATSSNVAATSVPRFEDQEHSLREAARHSSRCLNTSLRIGIASGFVLIRPSGAASASPRPPWIRCTLAACQPLARPQRSPQPLSPSFACAA